MSTSIFMHNGVGEARRGEASILLLGRTSVVKPKEKQKYLHVIRVNKR